MRAANVVRRVPDHDDVPVREGVTVLGRHPSAGLAHEVGPVAAVVAVAADGEVQMFGQVERGQLGFRDGPDVASDGGLHDAPLGERRDGFAGTGQVFAYLAYTPG